MTEISLIVVAALLGVSAFFSGSETALFSLSRLDLQKLRRERNRHSEGLHELLDQPRRLIISILCGNELVNIAASINMAGILVTLYGAERAGVIAVLVMVPLLLPIALGYNIHPVHLGIIFLANMQIGYFTPPVGMNLLLPATVSRNRSCSSTAPRCRSFLSCCSRC